MHIQRKGQAGKPLSECQERRNKRIAIAKVRVRVEHVFAGLEQMGGKALRSIGLARATLHLNWKASNSARVRFAKAAQGLEPVVSRTHHGAAMSYVLRLVRDGLPHRPR